MIASELTRRLGTQEDRRNQRDRRVREQAAIKAEYDNRQMANRLQLRHAAMKQRAEEQEPRIAREENRLSAQFSDEKLVFIDRVEDDLSRADESRMRAEDKAEAEREQNALKAALVTWQEHDAQWQAARDVWQKEEASWPSATHFWLFAQSGVGLVRPAHATPAVSQVLQNRAYVDAEHGAERERITHERFDLENERRQLDELRSALDGEEAEQQDENVRWEEEDAILRKERDDIASELQRRRDKEDAIEKDISAREAERARQECEQEARRERQLLRAGQQDKRKLNQEARPPRLEGRMERLAVRAQESQERTEKETSRASEQTASELVLLFDRSAEDAGRSATRADIDAMVAERETNFTASQQEARCREDQHTARTEGCVCREEENSACLLGDPRGNPRSANEPAEPHDDDDVAKQFRERR